MGSGGSTEGVLAAVALKILGGQILARFKPRNEKDAEALKKAGISEKTIFTAEDLARGDNLTFTATGVIDGPMLQGVVFTPHAVITHSIVMRSASGTVRYLTTHHHEE